MKKKLAALLALSLTAVSSAGYAPDVFAASDEAGQETDAKALAEEYISRPITVEDPISVEIIEALIDKIQETYEFEPEVTEIKFAADDMGYVAQGYGWFEELFGEKGIRMTEVQGAENSEEELMARGDLNFANRMLYPFLLNKEKGADLVAVWATGNPAPGIVNVIVQSDSEYETFSDLKGKTIATSASSCPYVVTEELILEEGWEIGTDINIINTQEYVNALLAGEVDAIIYHPATAVNPILLNGEARVIANAPEDGVYVNGGGMRVIFTTNEFAGNYPNIVKAYIKIEEAIQAYQIAYPEEAAAYDEAVSRIPKENTIYWWEAGKETRFASDKSLSEIQEEVKKFYDWLIEYDEAFDGGADLDSAFAPQYFQAAQ